MVAARAQDEVEVAIQLGPDKGHGGGDDLDVPLERHPGVVGSRSAGRVTRKWSVVACAGSSDGRSWSVFTAQRSIPQAATVAPAGGDDPLVEVPSSQTATPP